MSDDGEPVPPAPDALVDAVVSPGQVDGGESRSSDAVVARAYAFLAAALAADGVPTRPALAAELAAVLGVQSLAVLHTGTKGVESVVAWGFAGEPLDALGDELVERAIKDGLPAMGDGAADSLQSCLVVPALVGGQPWGVLAVASSLPDAFDRQAIERVVDLASGLGVVLSPLTDVDSTIARSRERRLRRGMAGIIKTFAAIADDAPLKHAAKFLVDQLHDDLGWQRVLLVTEHPTLGTLPLAVAGDGVTAQDIMRLRKSVADQVGDAGPWFEGTAVRMEVPVATADVAVGLRLVVESTVPGDFDDIDEEFARAAAGLLGPLARRLRRLEAREDVERPNAASAEVQRRRFISLAHELRTPVTVMIGYADLIATPGPDSEQRQAYGATLARHGRALGRMVDNALITWQLDDGTLELANKPMSMRDAVLDAVDALGIEVSVDGVTDVKGVVDAFWFPRVIQALLDNARRYVAEGEIQVSSKTKGDVVRLAVHDDGPGIPAEELAHIFEAFHRGPDGGTGAHRGVGLGLTVAHQLMEAMGGGLEVASAPDYGTTFTITVARA